MSAATACRDDARRGRVRQARLNGLDFLEVSDDQRRLTVHFLGKAPEHVARGNVVIEGGRRIRGIRVEEVTIVREADPELDDRMLVSLDRAGDWSTYTLRMVEADERGRPTDERLRGFDAHYASLDFTFKAGCPSPLDCVPAPCPPAPLDTTGGPPSYLARDYESFRQLMLDRLSLIMPEWKERHVPDIGIALVELWAYVGDNLSYYQDAAATEAYLETARLRTSVRRHLRLIDYALHEGCNARAFVHVEVDDDVEVPRRDLFFLTAWEGMPAPGAPLPEDVLRQVPRERYEVFEPVRAHGRTLRFHPAHDHISLYTWGRGECCLPRGSTSATLLDAWVRDGEGGGGPEQVPQSLQPRDALTPSIAPAATLALRAPGKETAAEEDAGDPPPKGKGRDDVDAPGRSPVEHPAPPSKGLQKKPDGDQHPPHPDDPGQQPPDGPGQQPPPGGGEPGPKERVLRLQPGDLLLLEERIGPWTGEPADADPGHRHVVRLTRVTPVVDELDGTPVLEVEWHPADALPFDLCLSGIGRPPACEYLVDVSVARGNIVLVDHGETVLEEAGTVQPLPLEPDCGECGCPPQVVPGALPFRPALRQGPLTWAEPLAWEDAATAAVRGRDPARAVAAAWARFTPPPVDERGPERRRPQPRIPVWRPRPDLLGSWPGDHHFVVETDGGVSTLRFGDGELGEGPEAGAACTVRYRVGNGPAGNVGAGAIVHVSQRGVRSDRAMRPRNPLPATGGTAPEPLDQARMVAPYLFRGTLQRAVAAEDYARLAERHPRVQRAAAALGWSGSWHEVTVAIDPLGRVEADAALLAEVAAMLEEYRRIGHDVRVVQARYVPLEIALKVVVRAGWQQAQVRAALLARLGSGGGCGGEPGFFHPDRLSFGQGVHLSALVAAAQGVEGVARVEPTRFNRLHHPPGGEMESGVLPLGPLEVARLDADWNAPDNGVLTLDMAGGR